MFLFYLSKIHTLRAWYVWGGVIFPNTGVAGLKPSDTCLLPKVNPRWGLRGGGWDCYTYNTGVIATLNTCLQLLCKREENQACLDYPECSQ